MVCSRTSAGFCLGDQGLEDLPLIVGEVGRIGSSGTHKIEAPSRYGSHILLLQTASQTPSKTLDFSHLGAKAVGYARHRNPPKKRCRVRTLPPRMVQALVPFAPLFSKRVFRHARVLLIGAILAPGARTVSSALRAMGLDQEKSFHRYHRVLSRSSWSSLEVSRVLLRLLVETFVPEG